MIKNKTPKPIADGCEMGYIPLGEQKSAESPIRGEPVSPTQALVVGGISQGEETNVPTLYQSCLKSIVDGLKKDYSISPFVEHALSQQPFTMIMMREGDSAKHGGGEISACLPPLIQKINDLPPYIGSASLKGVPLSALVNDEGTVKKEIDKDLAKVMENAIAVGIAPDFLGSIEFQNNPVAYYAAAFMTKKFADTFENPQDRGKYFQEELGRQQFPPKQIRAQDCCNE